MHKVKISSDSGDIKFQWKVYQISANFRRRKTFPFWFNWLLRKHCV